ncbi:MAG: heme exporter protein CcmD [Gammaproteobacteria bacterium]|jgi:heme exporter protein D|nr:heme exporter protein CcmD [Zhongshania sp.]MBU0538202.1 heme exporter protein CcmD [Gammaproteobacteria bacterium]MBU1834116.1 heme exporter protein CcmD [Gammaproteobacteria bacterium]
MYFDSVGDLLRMSGHGSYVWFCYGATVFVLVTLVVVARRRRKQAELQIRAIVRRKNATSATTK